MSISTAYVRHFVLVGPILTLMVLAATLVAPALAGDEQHQVVRTVSARFNDSGTELQLTLLLGNGDNIRKVYGKDAVPGIVKILDLALRKDVRLYADLRGKELAALHVEFGAPVSFGGSRDE